MTGAGALGQIPSLGRPPEEVLEVLGWIGIALLVGTAVRLAGYVAGRRSERALLRSLESWWALALVFTLAVLVGRAGVVALTAGFGLVGIDEYVRLAGGGRRARLGGAAGVLLAHLWVLLDWPSYYRVGFPAVLLAVALLALLARRRPAWSVPWGVLVCGFCLAHVHGLFDLAGILRQPPAAGLGLVVFLVVTTEINDIAQALWGRRFGHRPLAPILSPRKSWEGLLGGVATTVVVGLAIGPRLLPAAPPSALGDDQAIALLRIGLTAGLVAVAGVAGDLAMSSLKRRAGVKDSGTLLPGQGGALDRIDSLTASAPVLAYWLAVGWR